MKKLVAIAFAMLFVAGVTVSTVFAQTPQKVVKSENKTTTVKTEQAPKAATTTQVAKTEPAKANAVKAEKPAKKHHHSKKAELKKQDANKTDVKAATQPAKKADQPKK